MTGRFERRCTYRYFVRSFCAREAHLLSMSLTLCPAVYGRKGTKMNRNNDSLNFDHKSHYNDDRDSYIDKNGNYVYTQWVKVGKSYERRVVDIIPLTEENRDIIILLDGSDHDMDLQDRYAAENADYGMENRKQRQADGSQTDGDDDQTFDSDPMESIADPRADVMKTLFPDDTQGNPLVMQVEEFIETHLKPAQQDMIYGHLGEGKYLEDLRREENERTGKEVKKAAYHDRWDRIIQKGCRYFGVEKPKQQKKRK